LRFEIVHEFEIPLDALELAVLSPDLFSKLKTHLANMEDVTQKAHSLEKGVLHRVWAFQASVKGPGAGLREQARDARNALVGRGIDVRSQVARGRVERLAEREARVEEVLPGRGQVQALHERAGARRSARSRASSFWRVPIVQKLGERAILGEVRRMFDAEAETLREMATLV